MTRLRVLRGGAPRLKPELEGGSSTFDIDVAGWSWYGRATTLFVLLLPPGLKRELLLLCVDLSSRFGFEE